MSIKYWRDDIKKDEKKYSNKRISLCYFAHHYNHVYSTVIEPGPPRWVAGHGTADRTFTWLQRTTIYFLFFFSLPLDFSSTNKIAPDKLESCISETSRSSDVGLHKAG